MVKQCNGYTASGSIGAKHLVPQCLATRFTSILPSPIGHDVPAARILFEGTCENWPGSSENTKKTAHQSARTPTAHARHRVGRCLLRLLAWGATPALAQL